MKAKLDEEPSFTVRVDGNVAVGSTLAIVTAVVYSVKPPSLSMIRALTVWLPGPSPNEQLTDAVVPALA